MYMDKFNALALGGPSLTPRIAENETESDEAY